MPGAKASAKKTGASPKKTAAPKKAAPKKGGAGAGAAKVDRESLAAALDVRVAPARVRAHMSNTVLKLSGHQAEIEAAQRALVAAKESGKNVEKAKNTYSGLKANVVRLSDGSYTALAALASDVIRECLEATMNVTLADEKVSVKEDHFRDAPLEQLNCWPLIRDLPAVVTRGDINNTDKAAEDEAPEAAAADDDAETLSFKTYVSKIKDELKETHKDKFEAFRIRVHLTERLSNLITQLIERLTEVTCESCLHNMRTLQHSHIEMAVKTIMGMAGANSDDLVGSMDDIVKRGVAHKKAQSQRREENMDPAKKQEREAAAAALEKERAQARLESLRAKTEENVARLEEMEAELGK